ncbi:LLM class oxidoreductase [Agromyces aerolatus]|uniref:LLM class flavin-dependent oxidoreductase n=1 Tax=Agromyces sp. LY-1074 TaxID=3074080 RepID=UPI00286550B7|nr:MULTISPECIES: LLM class flavin-dependent oxidoreductase [unclassified Agromyces]MDR5698719.1 LLM class flavin-dependent oxidoreductase [Agromyces sp. LY-1074]MDR5705013.1 LLM class flavin-dependent oxidoreductase [Agromyces sp. LY-1358]
MARRTAVSIGIHGRTPADAVRALAPRLERLGFATLWINDVPGGDSLAGLRVAAEATTALGLATGVIPLDRRPVGDLDLSGLPADRTTLGIGSGGARRPLGLIEGGLAELRERTKARLVVGALGPRMRRLAAERADGVLLNWLSPAAAAEADRELRRDAGEHAVRSILYVRTIADESARPALEREAASYGAIPAYAANFARLGITPLEATLDGPERLAGFEVVDELVLRAITPTGSLAELERFAETTATWLHA